MRKGALRLASPNGMWGPRREHAPAHHRAALCSTHSSVELQVLPASNINYSWHSDAVSRQGAADMYEGKRGGYSRLEEWGVREGSMACEGALMRAQEGWGH